MSREIDYYYAANLVIDTYSEFYELDLVEVSGLIPPSRLDDSRSRIWSAIGELAENAAQNFLNSPEETFKVVKVIFEKGKVTIEDSFVNPNAEEDLERLNGIIKTGKPNSSRASKDEIRGIGVISATKHFTSMDGKLSYQIIEGRIIAIGTFAEDMWTDEELEP